MKDTGLEDKDKVKEIAARIADAIEKMGFFIFDGRVDASKDVFEALRSAGIEQLVNITKIDQRYLLYIVEVKEEGCRRICYYERGCRSDDECLNHCIAECTTQLRQKAAEALRHIERRGKR